MRVTTTRLSAGATPHEAVGLAEKVFVRAIYLCLLLTLIGLVLFFLTLPIEHLNNRDPIDSVIRPNFSSVLNHSTEN